MINHSDIIVILICPHKISLFIVNFGIWGLNGNGKNTIKV